MSRARREALHYGETEPPDRFRLDGMLIQAAINGARTRAEHPGLPVTPREQAGAAVEAATAGAGAVHAHVRNGDGQESLAAHDVARALDAIRAAAPGVPIGISTGAWIVPDPDARLAAVAAWAVLLDLACVNFHERGAGQLAGLLLSRGVAVEAGLRDARAAEQFAGSGLAERCLRVLLEPQEQDTDAALRAVAEIEQVLDRARVTRPRLLHGTDRTVWPLIDTAAARGYDTRIGFEDTLTLPDGSPAPSNGALVATAHRRVLGATGA